MVQKQDISWRIIVNYYKLNHMVVIFAADITAVVSAVLLQSATKPRSSLFLYGRDYIIQLLFGLRARSFLQHYNII